MTKVLCTPNKSKDESRQVKILIARHHFSFSFATQKRPFSLLHFHNQFYTFLEGNMTEIQCNCRFRDRKLPICNFLWFTHLQGNQGPQTQFSWRLHTDCIYTSKGGKKGQRVPLLRGGRRPRGDAISLQDLCRPPPSDLAQNVCLAQEQHFITSPKDLARENLGFKKCRDWINGNSKRN